MAIDPNIANPMIANLGGSMAQGAQYGNLIGQARQANNLRNVYAQHGPGILAGEQQALNALAAAGDPRAALGIQQDRLGMDATRLGMDATRQSMTISAENLQMARTEAKRQAAEHARRISKEEAEAEAEKAARALSALSMAKTPDQLEVLKAQVAPLIPDFDMSQVTVENLPMLMEVLVGAGEGYAATARNTPDPMTELNIENQQLQNQKLLNELNNPKPGFRMATREEAEARGAVAGQFGPDNRFYPLNPPSGTSIEVGPDGTVRLTQGAGALSGEPSVGDVYNPGEALATVALIDEIANDPNLARVVGPVIGGGGNDIENLTMPQRLYYGEGGLAVIEKINQLQSRSWLAARKMLKGGGPITDYESRKAEAAVARLSRAKGDKEYQAALKDLRDAITDGVTKLEAARGGTQQPAAPPAPEDTTQTAPTPSELNNAILEEMKTLSNEQLQAIIDSEGQ